MLINWGKYLVCGSRMPAYVYGLIPSNYISSQFEADMVSLLISPPIQHSYLPSSCSQLVLRKIGQFRRNIYSLPRSEYNASTSLCQGTSSFNTVGKPVLISQSCATRKVNWNSSCKPRGAAFEPLKATESNSSTKINSILCTECEGNGAKKCTQCGGTGVNSVDHFNGQFKAGALCWLCRGKKEILCGNCNGAGFVGGFLSACDD